MASFCKSGVIDVAAAIILSSWSSGDGGLSIFAEGLGSSLVFKSSAFAYSE